MDGFSYGIFKALVTNIDLDANIKTSMNEINTAQRMRVTDTERKEEVSHIPLNKNSSALKSSEIT